MLSFARNHRENRTDRASEESHSARGHTSHKVPKTDIQKTYRVPEDRGSARNDRVCEDRQGLRGQTGSARTDRGKQGQTGPVRIEKAPKDRPGPKDRHGAEDRHGPCG